MRPLFQIAVSSIRSRGRTWLFALLTVITVACSASGQENHDKHVGDTSFTPLRYPAPGVSFRNPMYPSLSNPPMLEIEFSIFLRQSLTQVGPVGRGSFQNVSTIQSIWKDELTRQNKYLTLRNILGAVQVGAVAYLAYRHLSRYGLK